MSGYMEPPGMKEMIEELTGMDPDKLKEMDNQRAAALLKLIDLPGKIHQLTEAEELATKVMEIASAKTKVEDKTAWTRARRELEARDRKRETKGKKKSHGKQKKNKRKMTTASRRRNRA